MASFGQEARFSKKEIQNDLIFLELQLKKHHPNLYVYTPKNQIDSSFMALREDIPDSTNKTQAYNIISYTSSFVKDGHYNVIPSQQTIVQFYKTSTLLPLDIYWTDGKAFITRNYSEMEVEEGSQLLSINNIEVNQIQETILNRVLRDGNNTTYPYWILNNFFRAYYNFCFGPSDNYKISLVGDTKKPQIILLKGLTHKELSEARKDKYPNYALSTEREKGIDLKVEKNMATLTIKSFENKMLKESYNQKFKNSIRSHFLTIAKNPIEHLIIDIRGNQGGEVTNGIFLLKYLLAEPFQAVQGFTKVDKKNFESPAKRNKTTRGVVDGFHTPFKDNYTGNIYLLVNGGSFSCSGIFSQVLKKTKRAVIIGTETGGSAYTVVGAPNKEITLPNTQIQITIPLHQFILQEYKEKNKSGVMPDFNIEPVISDILCNQDTQYNLALKMIAK